MADRPLSIDDLSRPAGEISAKEKEDLSSISSAAQPEADVIDVAKEYAKGLVQGVTEQAPSAGGLYGGARLGFQAGTRIPLGQPYTTVAATVAGGLTGLLGGNQLGEQLGKQLYEEQTNPELKPFREAGRTTGGGLAYLPLGYTIPATTGVRVLDFLGKLGTFARSHPILYGALETQSAVGAGVGAGTAEALAPGETLPRVTGEIIGGLLNPSKMVTTASLPLVDLIKRGVSRFSAGQREARAANRLAAILEENFQPELRQADPEKWADAYNNDYLPRLIQALKDPGIVPGMTAAQKTGDLPLTVLETSLARQNDEFGPKVAEQGRKAQEAVIRMINMLNQSGDPTMLQEAARLRDSYLRQLLDGRLAAADAKSAIAIAGISKDSPANRARIGQIIRDNVDSALKDAREVEHTLWSDVPKAIRAQVDETVAAMQKQGANRDQIQAAVARLTDGQAVVANSFTKQFDAIRSEMSPEYYNREFPAIVKDIYGRLSRARTVKGTPPDQLFALGKEANPELATALSTAQKDLQTTKASIDASSEITKRLANITKDGKYTLEVRVPEAPYRRTLDLTSAPDKRALAKKLIDVTTGKLPRESLSDAMRDYEIVGIYKGKGDNATEITFKELTDLKQVGSLKETYTTLQNQIKDTQKNLIESGKDFIRRGAINVGDLVNARRDMLRLAMDAEARGERANYAFYSKFSEALLNDMEQVRNPAYDAARAFSKELNDSFTRTFAGDMRAVGKTGAERIIPEVLVSRAFSGNSDIVNARLQQIQDAVDMLPRLHSQYVADFGPNDPRTRILEDAVNRAGPRAVSTADAVDRATRLAAAASIDPQTNRLNTTRLSRWLNENETLVNSIPGLRYDLENSIRAQNSLDLITKQNSAISKKIEKQVAFSKFLGENPSEAVADAINSKNPALSMRRLAQAASTGMGKGQNQDMVDALKSAVYDYAYAKAGGDKLNFKAYNDVFFAPTSTGRPALADILADSGVMNRGELANIKKLTGELARVEAVMGNKQILDRVLETSDVVEDLVLRIVGGKMGKDLAGSDGPTLLAASAGSKMMREMFDRMPNESVRGLLEQASRDPAFMVRLLEKGRSEQDKIRFAKQLRGYLINAGLTAAEEEEQPALAAQVPAPQQTAQKMLKRLPAAPQARGLLGSFSPAQQPGRPQAQAPAGQPQPQAREMLQRLFPFDAVLR